MSDEEKPAMEGGDHRVEGAGSSDEGQMTTDCESDRPPTELSMSGAVADSEGSSPEPNARRGQGNTSAGGEEAGTMEPGAEGGTVEPGAEGGTVEPGTVEPGAEGGTVEPGTVEPGTVEPGAEGGTVEPGAEGGTVEPGAEGGTVEPGAEAGTVEPGSVEPGSVEPGIVEPGSVEPGTEAGTVEPGAEAGTVEPGTEAGTVEPVKVEGEEKAPKTVEAKEDESRSEEKRVISYDYDQMKSAPELVNVTTSNMLELYHSFGYECQKRSNLVVLAKDTVAFAAGNLVQLLALSTQEQTYIRTLGGGGVGALAVHPSHGYLAVGEKGVNPVIAIYTYPDLRLHRILRGGTEEVYSHMDFSPGEGKLLASVGGSPDFMLTVWDWERENIVLRSKAFSQDIYRVTFSPENPGQLTTSGTGHIRFWKMATTFTGLKLQGQLGKFGRTELSDISAYVELPDGKVLSGTEWGNLLLWDGGFIKVEISKKGKKPCHHGIIEAIYLDEGELISAGADGFVRVWDFETIDSADITEDNPVFEMEPLTEIKVGNDVSLKSLSRSVDPDTPTLWYAQDAGGAIWKIDITVLHTRKSPEKLVKFHSGKIVGLGCSPIGHQAASIAEDGSVRVYDLDTKAVMCHARYSSGGSSLLWPPLSGDSTLVAGFQDGVIRVLKVEKSSDQRHQSHTHQLTLAHASKPHNKAVSSLAVNQERKILATGGKDCTVFFLDMEAKCDPIGFIKTPSPVTTIQWSADSKSILLVCCEDGSMLEVEGPVKEDYDTSMSYHLTPLKPSVRKFTSIKDRLRREEEEARKSAERERKRQEKERIREQARQRRREELGDDYDSSEEVESEGEEEEGEEEEEQPATEEVEKQEGPGSMLAAFYSQDDRSQFWVSMSGYDAGYLYRCSMEGAGDTCEQYEAPHTVPVPPFGGEDLALHSLTFSSSGEYLLTGSSHGCVRVHPLSQPFSMASLQDYWAINMHDNHNGAVTHIAITSDDQYVLSAGADGNVFVYEAALPTAKQRQSTTVETGLPPELGKPAKDIEDSSHYSIEDAKQKAEHDRKMKLAEEKKQHVRRVVASLRRTFRKLQQRSGELPPHLQLETKEFVMDPGMETELRQRAEEKVDLVRRQMAWESEKHDIALKKLQNRFKAAVECERVTVWTFTGEHHVSSHRSITPSKEYLELMEKVLSSELAQTPWTVAGKRTRKVSHGKGEDVKDEGVEGEGGPQPTATLSKTEARRLKKEQRKREWEELYRSKPDEKFADPAVVAELQHFKENMGDYKLKTSGDYVVPEHQRVSTEKKRRQLLLLRRQIMECKKAYNMNLLALRDWKLQVVDKISSLVGRIADLQSELPPSLHTTVPKVPLIHPEEVPERQLEYTRESLLVFKTQQKAREEAERQAAAGMGDGFGGFGGFGGGGDQPQEEKEPLKEEEEREVVDEEAESGPPSTPQLEQHLSPLQALQKQEQQVSIVYERDSLLREIEEMKSLFDEALLRLRHEKANTDVTLITADLRHITQFEELQLLKEFEKRETTFTSRYRARKEDKREMEGKIEEAQWVLSEKEKQLGKLQEQEKVLHTTFLESIGENNKFKDFLLKVFTKKIKRVKRKVESKGGEEGGGQEDEESEDESDSDYLSSSEDETDSEAGGVDDTVCPPGCDPAHFNQAVTLREQRLDLEELIAEEKRGLESQRKELEGSKKRLKTMEAHVKTALTDLQAFQLKKQQRLNELDQVVVLKLHQMLTFRLGGLPPTSIAPCLVFPAPSLLRLTQRIGELAVEKQQEKKIYRELKLKHVKLVRGKKEMEQKVAELDTKAKDMMMLKFGRVVDLDKLEGLSTNRIVEELKGKLKEMETNNSREIAATEAEISARKQLLVAVTREHTQRLDKKYELVTNQKRMEERLNARQKSMSQEVGGGDSHLDRQERLRLRQLVRLQTQDIEEIKEEIWLLSHKGGHILPPTQPPDGLPPLQ